MTNPTILPTEENLISTLEENILGRNQDILSFYDFIIAQESSSSIAIDGRWGSGKTFFIKHTILALNAMNPSCKMSTEKRAKIKKSLKLEDRNSISPDQYLIPIYYDAWENDNDTNPLLSIMYEIARQMNALYLMDGDIKVLKAFANIIEITTGRDFTKILKSLKSPTPQSTFKENKQKEEAYFTFFSTILEERANRLVIFIDELDRCKPSYAVRLLEQIKHYLCDDRIIFVYSTNLEQLQHTIKQHYGIGFDATRYLDRFFTFTLCLPKANTTRFFTKYNYQNTRFDEVCMRIIELYQLELREASQFYAYAKATLYEQVMKTDCNSYLGRGRMLIYSYIAPLLIALRLCDIDQYDKFSTGQDPKPLVMLFADSKISDMPLTWLTGSDEILGTESTTINDSGKRLITQEDLINRLYTTIFIDDTSRDDIRINGVIFPINANNFAINASSLISNPQMH